MRKWKTTDKEKEEANKSAMNTKCENPQRLNIFACTCGTNSNKTTEQEHQQEEEHPLKIINFYTTQEAEICPIDNICRNIFIEIGQENY